VDSSEKIARKMRDKERESPSMIRVSDFQDRRTLKPIPRSWMRRRNKLL